MIQLLSQHQQQQPSQSQSPTPTKCQIHVVNKPQPQAQHKRSIFRSSRNDNNSKSTNTIATTVPSIVPEDDNDNNHIDDDQESIALFHRHEIRIGELVGTGSFSEVYEIASFDLSSKSPHDKKKKRRSFIFSPSATSNALTQQQQQRQQQELSPARRKKRHELVLQHEHHLLEQCLSTTTQPPKSRFVIKYLHPKLLVDPKLFCRAVRDMETEVAIMSDLHHPHIAALRGTALNGSDALENGNHHDGYFLVLDRLHETLDDRITQWNHEKIQQGPSYYLETNNNDNTDSTHTHTHTHTHRMQLKANYAWQIASALSYLHERKIIYRDLKPQNCGFQSIHPHHPERDVVVLFDFGLSRHLPTPDKATEDGQFRMSLVGTRRYMAPEVVLTRTYDLKADVYSFALVLFEMLTQSRPYDGIQRDEHREFICRQGKRPKIYSYYKIPDALETLLRLAWAQDVAKRCDMKHVCRALQSYLQGTIHEQAVLQMTERFVEASPSMLADASFSSSSEEDSNCTTTTENTMSTTGSTHNAMSPQQQHHNSQQQQPSVDNEMSNVNVFPRDITVSVSLAMPSLEQQPNDNDNHNSRTEDIVAIAPVSKKRVSYCEQFYTMLKAILWAP